MNRDKLYERYQFYKRKCSEQNCKIQEMQTVMSSCQKLLGGSLLNELDPGHSSGIGSPLISSTPKSSRTTPKQSSRRILVESSSFEDSTSPGMLQMETEGNRWDLLTTQERKDISLYNRNELENTGKKQPAADLDETFFEPVKQECKKVEEQVVADKAVVKEASPSKSLSVSSNSSVPVKKKKQPVRRACKSRGRRLAAKTGWLSKPDKTAIRIKPTKPAIIEKEMIIPPRSPGHVCKGARCKKHQPCYVSSAKELASLSPESAALATRVRSKSPANFWDLTI